MVISPAIETDFGSTYAGNVSFLDMYFPHCVTSGVVGEYKGNLCFVIGFIARLAKEKACLMFLLSIKKTLDILPQVI